METRHFGKTGLTPSILGFGMMRLKRKADGTIDEQWAIDTLRYAIDHGLTYVDTAYVYEGSERVTGLCLQDGYREKVTLATKLPVVNMTCPQDFDRMLDEQLERLQTDHIDLYLLHAMNRARWENVEKYNVLESAERAKAQGKIKHIGFSFHDNLDFFRTVLDAYDKWDFCQIQLNYMDVNYQAGIEGLKEAHRRGLAVVIMEPLRGGKLAAVPEKVAAMLPGNPVECALDFLWDMPEVNVVLSGMGETSQVEQNLAFAARAHAGMLTEQQRETMIKAGNVMRSCISIPCTGCNYCNVCPKNIAISEIFALQNLRQLNGDARAARATYATLGDRIASRCISCNTCTQSCPQNIDIPTELQKLAKIYG
ncbi:MAG: aldo/keto reductase [Oscillospiraceae bacterium]|nr:aldo/keto reductase [Oscillospiraceae bacterium]